MVTTEILRLAYPESNELNQPPVQNAVRSGGLDGSVGYTTGSDQDLTVYEFQPHVLLGTDSTEPA